MKAGSCWVRLGAGLVALPLVASAEEAPQAPTAVRVARSDCVRLMAEPGAGSPAYVHGRDVRGRPVVPADLDAPAGVDLLAAANIEIEIFSGLAADHWRHDREAAVARTVIGTLGFDAAGRLTLNGKPVSSGDRARMTEFCAAAGVERP
jgi:hypothetical protein